jgi:hypothetical protein
MDNDFPQLFKNLSRKVSVVRKELAVIPRRLSASPTRYYVQVSKIDRECSRSVPIPKRALANIAILMSILKASV